MCCVNRVGGASFLFSFFPSECLYKKKNRIRGEAERDIDYGTSRERRKEGNIYFLNIYYIYTYISNFFPSSFTSFGAVNYKAGGAQRTPRCAATASRVRYRNGVQSSAIDATIDGSFRANLSSIGLREQPRWISGFVSGGGVRKTALRTRQGRFCGKSRHPGDARTHWALSRGTGPLRGASGSTRHWRSERWT